MNYIENYHNESISEIISNSFPRGWDVFVLMPKLHIMLKVFVCKGSADGSSRQELAIPKKSKERGQFLYPFFDLLLGEFLQISVAILIRECKERIFIDIAHHDS
jgi:hypothetical protein